MSSEAAISLALSGEKSRCFSPRKRSKIGAPRVFFEEGREVEERRRGIIIFPSLSSLFDHASTADAEINFAQKNERKIQERSLSWECDSGHVENNPGTSTTMDGLEATKS